MSFVEAALSNEEDRLWLKIRESRDQKARNLLVERYLPYARQVAASLFARRPDNDVEFADYMQYASIGLIEAVDRYEASKGAMFKTFAGYRIKGAIRNGVKSATEKRQQYVVLHEYAKDRIASIAASSEEVPETDLFSEMVELTIGLALGYMLDDSGASVISESAQGSDPYRGHAFKQTRARIEKAVAKLDEREKHIIQYHYYHQMSFESLADLYGLSKGRISQLHKQALHRIRSTLQDYEAVNRVY